MYPVQAGRPAGTASIGGGLGQAVVEGPQKSIASAFETLNREVETLEKTGAQLYEQAKPFLEPSVPTDQEMKEGQARSASPLADSVFEYAARIRRARLALSDISERIAL